MSLIYPSRFISHLDFFVTALFIRPDFFYLASKNKSVSEKKIFVQIFLSGEQKQISERKKNWTNKQISHKNKKNG
jgi:hypothetical protein